MSVLRLVASRAGHRACSALTIAALTLLTAPAHAAPGNAQPPPTSAGVQLTTGLNGPVHGGAVSVGVAGRQMSVKEAWRTREDRLAKYDVAQAYARYYCGSSNVLNVVGDWLPGFSERGGFFLYEDTVRFECLRPEGALLGGPPMGIRWSRFDAAAWLAPYEPESEVVRAELRFGALPPVDTTALVQLALRHAATAFRSARCKTVPLPVARYIETKPSPPGARSDIILEVAFSCD